MKRIITTFLFACLALGSSASHGNLSGFSFKIYYVNSTLYPFVQVYMRTFDEDFLPIESLNELQVALMDRGRVYEPEKKQYFVESLRDRQEAVRLVAVLDNSKSMEGEPFNNALKGTARVIDSKRPQDQMAVVALTDDGTGYTLVSNFEKDRDALIRRVRDVKLENDSTRLYDAIAASLQLCGASSQGEGRVTVDSIVISCSILVFSDGTNEDSAMTRSDLMNRITELPVPLPIYSYDTAGADKQGALNLQALSLNSFGRFYDANATRDRLTASIDQMMDVITSDYVLTFRAYAPMDGNNHPFKVALEYPSRSGKYWMDGAHYEAIDFPDIGGIGQAKNALNDVLEPVQDGNPYVR